MITCDESFGVEHLNGSDGVVIFVKGVVGIIDDVKDSHGVVTAQSDFLFVDQTCSVDLRMRADFFDYFYSRLL